MGYLRGAMCLDCGESDLVVLDFDHIGPKRGTVISLALQEHSIDSLMQEIDECAVRCANCHRRQTVRRQPTHLRHHLL